MRAALLLLLLAPLPATSQAQDQQLLFLGNSYTAGNDLAALVQGWLQAGVPAWAEVAVERSAPGGYRLPQHLADAQGANPQVADWLSPGSVPWDTVILQDQSQVPGFYSTTPSWQESRDAAAALHQIIGASGADTMLFLTWGRRTGDDTNPTIFGDFPAMQDRLTAGYLAFAEGAADVRPVFIAPVGEAWRLVHDALVADGEIPASDGTAFWDLYVNDGSHPSASGSYLTAAVIFAALTGRSPVGLSAPPESVDDALATTLQRAAHDAVLVEPFGAFRYPWAVEAADWVTPADTTATGDLVVSARGLLPLVRMGDATLDTIRVGVAHAAGPGDGRVLVEGTVTAGTIALADDADSAGDLLVEGTLTVGDITSGGAGNVRSSGDLTVTGSAGASITQTGGAIRLGSGAQIQDWTQVAGRAEFDVTTGRAPVEASGIVTLGGTIAVTADAAISSIRLLRAPTIRAIDATWELPEGWTGAVAIDVADGRAILWAGLPSELPDTLEDGPDSCGCAQSGATPQGLAALLVLMVATRRARWRRAPRG